MTKKMKIRLYPNGQIKVETEGVKGKKCVDYANLVADAVNAKITEKVLTKEYSENEEIEQNITSQKVENLYE
ncbi:DUF2997 domain-containing protein [bacterium]|nr:DUF2997 domain-containing protein [bacterium]